MAIATELEGNNFALEFLIACSVIFSSAVVMYLDPNSPVFTQGMLPLK